MKKYLKTTISRFFFAIVLLIVVAFMSCSEKDLLDLKPHNQIDENLAFSSVDNIEKSLNGVYNIAQKGYFERRGNNLKRGYPFGAAYFEQNDLRGEDMINVYSFYRYTYTSTYNTNTDNNGNYWVSLYKLINESNLVMRGVSIAKEKNIITPEQFNDYTGQVLFFRAYSYLELLKHFSRPYHHTADASHMGVPYLTKPSVGSKSALENSKTGRGTVKEDYESILKDLNEAEKLLGSSKKILRVTKNAVIALKSRVYLNMRKWDKVIEESNKLDGQYTLTAKPDTPFRSARGNTESIFSLDNSATNNPGVNGGLASQYKKRPLIAISPIIWNSKYWDKEDQRRKLLTQKRNGIMYIDKYTDTKNLTDPSPLFRYAEILLNKAEAKLRLNDDTFIADLNKVRGRSTTKTYKLSDFTNDKEKLAAIIYERRIEYLAEGMRWGDIHRLQKDPLTDYDGIPAKYLNGQPKPEHYVIGTEYVFNEKDLKAIPYSSFKFLWPIPTSEVSVNPVLAKQQIRVGKFYYISNEPLLFFEVGFVIFYSSFYIINNNKTTKNLYISKSIIIIF